jgi:hypothetical protein
MKQIIFFHSRRHKNPEITSLGIFKTGEVIEWSKNLEHQHLAKFKCGGELQTVRQDE